MSTPRDHHFIPAFYLKQWAGPNGKLIEYTIKHGKLIAKPVGPHATGYETDLYAFHELPPDVRQFGPGRLNPREPVVVSGRGPRRDAVPGVD